MSNDSGNRGRDNPRLPDIALAVKNGIDRELINALEKFGNRFQASNTQVRNIYTAVKQLESSDFDREAFLMLRPRLAYAAQREKKLKPLRDVLSPAVNEVLDTESEEELVKRFRRFCLCCEAIVAYARK